MRQLVRSLAQFDLHVREWKDFIEAGGLTCARPELVFDIPEKGGIAADSVFHYLNLFIDDLACIVPIVLANDGAEPEEPDGFSKLMKGLRSGKIQAPEPLRKLFADLDCDNSWWSLGFKRATGIRQRLTHYTDIVYFEASTKPGDLRMTSDVSLISLGGPSRVPEFEQALQTRFKKLFAWLYQLDIQLLRHQSDKLAAKGVLWDPFSLECPGLSLPSQKEVRLDALHYLYLPISNPVRRTQ